MEKFFSDLRVVIMKVSSMFDYRNYQTKVTVRPTDDKGVVQVTLEVYYDDKVIHSESIELTKEMAEFIFHSAMVIA